MDGYFFELRQFAAWVLAGLVAVWTVAGSCTPPEKDSSCHSSRSRPHPWRMVFT